MASKIFLASSLVILVLVGVAAWSLRAVDRLVSVNREITTQTIPALRLQGSLRESLLTLVRLETRYLVLRDPTYRALWNDRAGRIKAELDLVGRFITSDEERARLEEVEFAFAEYRAAVTSERELLARGHLQRAAHISETDARAASERAEAGLDRLMDASQAALEHSQPGMRLAVVGNDASGESADRGGYRSGASEPAELDFAACTECGTINEILV